MKSILLLSFLFTCSFAKANCKDTTLPNKTRTSCSSSLPTSKNPLYIINGKAITDSVAGILMNVIDVKLIQNIEIPIDSKVAFALYGSAAINGVIIITTKQTDFSPKPFCKPPEYKYDNYTL